MSRESMQGHEWTLLEDFLAETMQRERIPGVAVGLSSGGRTVYSRGFGCADLEGASPVNGDTIFGIASVSKSFAAVAILQLIDQGRVHPYSPVTEYLPEFTLPPVADMDEIWVHHCLSHTTGLPPLRRRQGEFTEFEQHLAYLSGCSTPLLGRPGEYLSYCNDTFMLAGAIVERLSGRRFGDHVRQGIFEPLELSRTTYGPVATCDNVITLYNPNTVPGGAPQPQPWPELGTYHVGGGIRSTVADLLRYADMFCAGGVSPEGRQVLSAASVLRMRAPVAPVSGGGYYCYALQTTPAYHGVTLVEHGGSLPGVASHWGYVPELGISAVVLTNLRGAPAAQIWTGLVNTAMGLPPGQPRKPSAPTYPASAVQLGRLSGVYCSDEGARVAVTCDAGQLHAEFEGQTQPLRIVAPDRATYVSQAQEKPLRFHLRGDTAPAWAMTSGVRMILRAE